MKFLLLVSLLLSCAIVAHTRVNTLVIEQVQCIIPSASIDAAGTAAIASLAAVAAIGVTIATGGAAGAGVAGIVGGGGAAAATAGGVATAAGTTTLAAVGAATGTSDFANRLFGRGADDLYITINGIKKWPPGGGHRAVDTGESVYPNLGFTFHGEKVVIGLWDYDWASNDDPLFDISNPPTIDVSKLKSGQTIHFRNRGAQESDSRLVIVSNAEEKSSYLVTARITTGGKLAPWVMCGADFCKDCPVEKCCADYSSSGACSRLGVDRDKDKEDLKKCPSGYRHYAYKEWHQMWPAANVFARICVLAK